MRKATLVHFVLAVLLPSSVGAPIMAQIPAARSQEPVARSALAGRVTDGAGEPLNGVTVTIPTLSRGVLTNRGGESARSC